MKSRKREKGKWGSELYMEQGQLCKHIECVEGKGFFCKKKSSQFLHNKMKRKWFIQSLWTPFSLWNYFISDQSDLVLIALFSPDYYPILFPLALCPSEASFERSYQPFLWQLFRYSNIQLLEFLGSCLNWADKKWLRMRGFGFEKSWKFSLWKFARREKVSITRYDLQLNFLIAEWVGLFG